MPYVESSIVVAADRGRVYELAKRMDEYPAYMADVEAVKVVEANGDRTVTDWTTMVEGIPICWKEEDVFDDAVPRIDYRLIEGDLDKFEGSWLFEELPEGTKVTLTVDFDFGMPTLADLLGPVLEMKVRENSEMMLEGIKAQIEGNA